MDRNEEYPNDKETQEWMNGSMGTPMKRESKQHRMEACPECDAEHQETVKFWMDKWEKRSDEFYALESENKELKQEIADYISKDGTVFGRIVREKKSLETKLERMREEKQ